MLTEEREDGGKRIKEALDQASPGGLAWTVAELACRLVFHVVSLCSG